MRCKACNKALNEFDSFVRDDVQAVENFDLMDLQDSVDIDDVL